MSFPKKLYFKYDDTVMELQKEVIENKVATGIYKYTKANVFMGYEIRFTKERVDEILRKEIAKIK